MAALVATKRNLSLNLTGIRNKDRSFLLDTQILSVSHHGNIYTHTFTSLHTLLHIVIHTWIKPKKPEKTYILNMNKRHKEMLLYFSVLCKYAMNPSFM